MNRKASAAALVGLVVAVTAGGFLLLQHPTRLAETTLAVDTASLLGPTHFQIVNGTDILESPDRGSVFLAIITPSCSSAASLSSFCGLALLIRRSQASPGRRIIALLTASTVVFTGNVFRITAVLVVGLIAGRGSLIMFHDWVASIFSFAFTLGGFILMMIIVLGGHAQRRAQRLVGSLSDTVHA